MTIDQDDCSSGYYSETTIKKLDEVDLGGLPECNLEKIIFDDNNQERPPFSLNCCCQESTVERSLAIILLYYFILLVITTFSITFLTVCDTENKLASGVLALLSTCLGNVLPGPRV